VPFYRANAQRTSVYPGPGPVCQPAIAWQQRLGKAANFTPIVVAGTVIVGDANGLHAFDARIGAARWTAAGRVGFAGSAGAADGVVFAADLGGSLHALDIATGTQRWSVALPNAGISPLVGDGLVWVGSTDGHAYGLDPASGGRRWSWTGPPSGAVHVPFVTDDTAYIRDGGVLHAVRLVDQTELWHYDTGGSALTGPILAGDTIYVGSQGSHSELAALDRTTGKNRWAPRFSIASGNQVTPGAVVGKTLYVGTDGDGLYALQDEGAGYKVVWHATGIRATALPPSYATGMLYVQPIEAPLVGLRATDGAKLWETAPSDPGSGVPVVTGGIAYQVDDEAQVLRAWAEPALVARLAAPTSSPAASPTPALPDPFRVTATHPWFQTGIQIPAAMALAPDGLLYVLHAKADFSNPQVTALDPTTGVPVRSWGRYGSGAGQLDVTGSDDNGPSGCIAIARNGDLYVGERGNQRVEEFTPDGRLIRQIGVGTLGFVLFCTVGPDGSLYTLDDVEGTMNKFGPSGQLIWHRLPPPGRGIHDFVFLPHGGFLGIVDATGEGVLIDPLTGSYAGHWGPAGQDYGASGEPSVDARGNVYVFHYAPSTLQVFDTHGRLLGGIYDDPSAPKGPYQFSNKAFWPSPVFAKDGSGYSFDSSGLVQLRVMLAGR